MFPTKKLAIIAAFALATLAGAACSNSLTDVAAARRDVRSTASHDSTGGGTCLSGWIVVDGIATCPGGH